MIDESFSPDELALIERLQSAPQPALRPAAFDAIRARMLDAIDTPVPAPQPTPRLLFSAPVIITIIILVAAATIALILIVSQPLVAEPTPPAATLTAVPSTSAPVIVPTLAPTASPVTPEITPEATQEVSIVIEGPVETINSNLITIFGNTVEIQPTDPLLNVIQVGDVLRVEGDLVTRGNVQVLIAITIIYVEVEVNVNPQTSEIWRDDGSCNNPPPDWAPANGWRRRCGQPEGQDQGMGMGKNDD